MSKEGEGVILEEHAIIPYTNKCPKCAPGWLSSKLKKNIAWVPTCNWCGFEDLKRRHHNRRKQQSMIWWAERRKEDN